MSQRSFRQKNERRLDLVIKKFSGGLTETEHAELAELKKWVEDWMEKRFPRNGEVLDEMDKRLGALKARLSSEEDGRSPGQNLGKEWVCQDKDT